MNTDMKWRRLNLKPHGVPHHSCVLLKSCRIVARFLSGHRGYRVCGVYGAICKWLKKQEVSSSAYLSKNWVDPERSLASNELQSHGGLSPLGL